MTEKLWSEFEEVTAGLYVKFHEGKYDPRYRSGFGGLVSEEIHDGFDTYVHVKPCVPHMAPTLTIALAPATPTEKQKEPSLIGRVAWSKISEMNIAFRHVGTAKAWLGNNHCVLWECFLHSGFFLEEWSGLPRIPRREGFDWKTLRVLWDWFENYLIEDHGVHTFYTHDTDPLYGKTPQLYVNFLKSRGGTDIRSRKASGAGEL